MNVTPLALPEVRLLVPERREDARGWVSATWERSRLAAAGVEADFLQDNQVNSLRAGTVRGLHFQAAPFAQAKLMRVLRGAAYDVAVDIRPGSPTFGRWAGARLSAEGGEQLYSPRGFARGCVTLTDDSELLLKVDRPTPPSTRALSPGTTRTCASTGASIPTTPSSPSGTAPRRDLGTCRRSRSDLPPASAVRAAPRRFKRAVVEVGETLQLG